MQKENVVPVGLFYSLYNAIFGCQVRFLAPFRNCCKAKIFRSDRCKITWGRFFQSLAKLLLIMFVPTPFYLRLVIFYKYEYEELERRKRATAESGLKERLESSLIYYFTPTHAVFICTYILYIVTAIALAFMSTKGKDHRVKKIITNSFRDLKSLNFTDTLSMMASNLVWPLENFGALGCCVGIVYWPLAMAGSLLVGAVYLLPTLYLTFRMAYHSKLAAVIMSRQSNDAKYKVRVKPDLSVYRFQTEELLRRKNTAENSNLNISLDDLDHIARPKNIQEDMDVPSIKSTLIPYPSFSWRQIVKYLFCAFLSILTLYALVIIISEVIGCITEIVVFTIMGCIVNASSLLKYAMLILMILVYCSDIFNNMQKKYLKINRALFNEVKYRIKDLEKVTSLPSSLQENCAFKAQELNEQAAYEASDDVVEKPPRHWMINDLVLFVDSEDTPRIPIQLFQDVIQIRVAGVPGPIYRGHIEAFRQLSKIVLFVLFVFLVVLSFGSVYKLSATNETLATMVGGCLPRMLRMYLAPPRRQVELGTLSFRSKMDEVIKNFCQYWPIYDLPFEVVTDEDETEQPQEKTGTNDNRCETPPMITRPFVSNERRRSSFMYSSHDLYDVPEQIFLPTQHPMSAESTECVEKSEDVTVALDDQVDIAICLPVWQKKCASSDYSSCC